MASNYDDVLSQLRAAGLDVDELLDGRLVRCRVEGDRERRGWYRLHEIVGHQGETLLVGSFGIWHGLDNGATKIKLPGARALTSDQRESLSRRLAEDRKRAEQARKADAERAAQKAASAWAKGSETGESPYLAIKGVGAHGVRYAPGGALLIPMLDTSSRIHGLQVIRDPAIAKRERRMAKEYWPQGLEKRGHFHLIGGVPTTVLLLCEGYATGATLYAATQLPVAVAFDAGNLGPVAAALHKRYPKVRILVCADDDIFATCSVRDDAGKACGARILLPQNPATCPACGNEHRRVNTGVTAASAVAVEVGGGWIKPAFADDETRGAAFLATGSKASDFNDLHLAEGLHLVRAQIEARLLELGWSAWLLRSGAGTAKGGAGADEPLCPIGSLDELLERFRLVYGKGGMVFDSQEHLLLPLGDMRDACLSREIHRAWMEHPDRVIVREDQVGFDPTERDASISCNLWAGWPTSPRAGSCEKLLDLLRYMCSADLNQQHLFDWVLRWVAYPIQHPGAKLKTCLVIHGPQGTGKNMFFEAVMSIYGRYSRVINQDALEDRFNSWASRKLFLIADEVVARSDLFHVKNKLKAFITGDRIRINPKNMADYEERNHVNVVFLSNEPMPVVLDEDDRRHAVIWTPEKLEPAFYQAVLDELENGGVAALHDHLLHLDLGDFHPGSMPPYTKARNALIDMSQDSTMRFYDQLIVGEFGITPKACLSTDLFDLYKHWCVENRQSIAPSHKFQSSLEKKRGVRFHRKRYDTGVKTLGPHAVALFGSAMPEDGQRELDWLGHHVLDFSNRLSDYKNGGPVDG